MHDTHINSSNQMNTINKACTPNQVIRCSSLCSRKRKKFLSKLSLLRFLTLSTNMTMLSTIIVSHIITHTVSNSVTWLPTLEVIHNRALTLRNMMPKLTTLETSHQSRSPSPTSLFPSCNLLSLLLLFVS